jgi:HAE1 family hydrophobic/amphiphilic exporter-1
MSIQEVNTRLSRENVNQAGGSLYEREARYLVRSNNEFKGLDDILETILVTREGRHVRVADIADVVRGHKPREVITRFGGAEAVELAIYKEGDANTVSVAKALQTRLDNIGKEIPQGVELVTGQNQAEFIQASIDEVRNNAMLGGIIAILVLLLFLKDLRSTLIIGISIPISIVTTFFLMYRTGTSLNIISLGGLALGVGMLVDNAIVVLEAIFKHREAGESALEAARKGGSEVGRAVIASTLTTVAVFLPVVFLEGMAAQLFRDMALTVSFALIASLAVSLTLIPMMAAVFGERDKDAVTAALAVKSGGRIRRSFRFIFVRIPAFLIFLVRWTLRMVGKGLAIVLLPITKFFDLLLGAVQKAYPAALRWSLRNRTVVMATAVLTFAGAISLVPRLGFDLMPSFSQGEFSFTVELPEGTPIEVTDRYVAEIQQVLDGDPLVASYSSISGGKGLSFTNTGTEGENTARLQVRMAESASPEDEAAVIGKLRESFDGTDDATFKFERPTYFSFRTPVELEIFSDNLDDLQVASTSLRETVDEIDGLVDVKSSMELGNPELQVTFDREQLTMLGLTLGDVAATMRNKVQGEVATRFLEGDREIDIMVRSVDLGRASVGDVENMIVGQVDGRPIYLKSVANIRIEQGPTEIRRIGQKRAALISGNLAGRDMGSVAQELDAAVEQTQLPPTVITNLGGQQEEMARSLRSMMMAMALAIFLVYLVMASQFESFLHPFVIIFTLPLGAIGVIGALALTGNSINVVAMIGAVMLAGIVVNNAIVLVDAVNQRRREGMSKFDALITAGSDRLRPILMTSATTILGLTPMALGLGAGAELRAPLAITVIGGLSVATLLTLFVIPVVYSVVDRSRDTAEVLETEPIDDLDLMAGEPVAEVQG